MISFMPPNSVFIMCWSWASERPERIPSAHVAKAISICSAVSFPVRR